MVVRCNNRLQPQPRYNQHLQGKKTSAVHGGFCYLKLG